MIQRRIRRYIVSGVYMSVRKKRKKVGLALGSGGIRGLAHVGVIKCLCRHGIPVDYIAGASIGAWVGAHYALFEDIPRLEQFTVGKRLEKLNTFFELTLKGGIVKGTKVQRLLDNWLGSADFESTKIPVRISAADIITGSEVVFSRGKLAPAVRASMSVPSVFIPGVVDGRFLIDGGVVNPVPVSVVKEMGADIIIAVNLDNYSREGLFTAEDVESLPRVTTRSIDLLRHHLARHCCRGAQIVIEPDNAHDKLSSWKNYFINNLGEEHMKRGDEAAEVLMPRLKKLLAR